MTAHSQSFAARPNLLRRALQGNALFSALTGAICVLDAQPIGSFIGIDVPVVFVALGVGLLGYALFLFRLATRAPINRRLALIASVMDKGWVVGSIVLLLSGWLPLTSAGQWTIVLVAVEVGLFSELQLFGLWQIRNA